MKVTIPGIYKGNSLYLLTNTPSGQSPNLDPERFGLSKPEALERVFPINNSYFNKKEYANEEEKQENEETKEFDFFNTFIQIAKMFKKISEIPPSGIEHFLKLKDARINLQIRGDSKVISLASETLKKVKLESLL